jgi:hypothetical protein
LIKNKSIVLAACLCLVLALVLSGCAIATMAATPAPTTTTTPGDKTYNCLDPQAGPKKIAFTGTLNDAQTFYQKSVPVATLGNALITQWTDGLPIIVPTEQKVREILTGTSHKSDEVMSVYTKDASGKWNKGTASKFAPSTNTATVEKVAINAVMAGCKPEYLPVVLAMLSGGPNYKTGTAQTGYMQIVSGSIVKELGINAGQGAMNPGNPPSLTIGRSFQLGLINLGGALPGSTNTNTGNIFSRDFLLYAEDGEVLPVGWVGMNEDAGFAKNESVIMLCQSSTMLMTTFAPSSFRGLNNGVGGIAIKLGVEGKPGKYNFVEYIMQWNLMPTKPFEGSSVVGPQGPMNFTIHPDMAAMLKLYGFNTKADFYKWVYDRTVTTAAEYRKYGWYDVLTNNGAAIEPTSGKAYKDLAPDYKVHVAGEAKDQLVIVSIYPGDESCLVFSGGKGIARCIDPWK